jgi:hypothetical protein
MDQLNSSNKYKTLHLNPFIRMEIYIPSRYDAFIKFCNEGPSSGDITFKKTELDGFLLYLREQMEPNIPHPIKITNFFKKKFYIKFLFPRKIRIINGSNLFTFNERVINKLFQIEEELYGFITTIQDSLPELNAKQKDQLI